MEKKIKGYKGFDKDLKCRGYQYEVGKDYEHNGEVSCCKSGFHFCENPMDVLNYYNPADSRYCEVEGSGTIDKDTDDTKVAVSKLHISEEIGLKGLIEAGVKFILDKVNWKDNKESNTGVHSAATNTDYQSAATNTGRYSAATNMGYQSAATNTGDYSAATNTGYRSAATNTGGQSAATNTGDKSAATNTGDQSAATNTGDKSAATNTGNRSAATNTGDYSAAINTGDYSTATNTGSQSAATNTGDYSAATNTGYRSAATNTGYRSAATNTGNYSAATNTGDRSAATNTGYRSAATVEGKDSIAIVTGYDSKAKGALGCWIVLTEHRGWNGNGYPIKEVKAFKVDGEIIKADTFYKLINGEAVEVEK